MNTIVDMSSMSVEKMTNLLYRLTRMIENGEIDPVESAEELDAISTRYQTIVEMNTYRDHLDPYLHMSIAFSGFKNAILNPGIKSPNITVQVDRCVPGLYDIGYFKVVPIKTDISNITFGLN